MFKYIILFFIVIYPIVPDEAKFSFSGTVQHKDASPGLAKVYIEELKKTVVTDENGNFIIPDLENGNYNIIISSPHHQPIFHRFSINGKDESFSFSMEEVKLDSSVIHVSGLSATKEKLLNPQSIHAVKGRELKKMRGQNLMSTIDNTPGVSTLNSGAGTSKPVIRGLTGNRVLVATDGVRQEDQQFSAVHTIQIGSYDVDSIEIIRGPASIKYGSDAMAGVVNIIRSKAPFPGKKAKTLSGDISYNGFSNNNQDAGSVSLFGANTKFGYRVHADGRKSGQIETPAGRLRNTGNQESNQSASIASSGDWGNFYIDSFDRKQTQEFYDNPNTNRYGTPFVKLRHQKTHLHGDFIFRNFNLEMDLGYQRNDRKFTSNKNKYVTAYNDLFSPTRSIFHKSYVMYQIHKNEDKQQAHLFLDTGTADVKLNHKEWHGLKGTIGLSGMNQKNRTIGVAAPIPSYDMINLGAFLYEEYKLDKFTFSLGGRADTRTMNVFRKPKTIAYLPMSDSYYATTTNSVVMDQTKNFYANTGTFGIVWNFMKHTSAVLNLSRGFRAPTAYELFAEGLHSGGGMYEIGDSRLRPEYSKNAEFSLRYITSKISAELAVFNNQIQDYIAPYRAGTFNQIYPADVIRYNSTLGYPAPVLIADIPRFEPKTGLPIYVFRQMDAVIRGVEFLTEAEVLSWLVIRPGFDLLYGKNITTGEALPMMTANRAKFGFKILLESLWKEGKPYIQFDGKFVAPQNRLAVFETRTPGYNLYDMSMGFEIPGLNTEEKATFDFIVQNMTNKKYVDHLNRYKAYSFDPGINMIFKATIPFTLFE